MERVSFIAAVWAVAAVLLHVGGLSSARAGDDLDLRDYYDSMSDRDQTYYVGETYAVDLRDLHPTQFGLAFEELKERQNKIKEKQEKGSKKLLDYLERHVGEVMIGPMNTYFLMDGHHLGRAMQLAGEEEMLVRVVANGSRLTFEEFFEDLIQKKRFWPYDENGKGPLSPASLPNRLEDLKRDEYRDLSWKVQKQGGYRKTNIPFAQFLWSFALREVVSLSTIRNFPDRALKKAMEFARSDQARGLPGYIPRKFICQEVLQ